MLLTNLEKAKATYQEIADVFAKIKEELDMHIELPIYIEVEGEKFYQHEIYFKKNNLTYCNICLEHSRIPISAYLCRLCGDCQ